MALRSTQTHGQGQTAPLHLSIFIVEKQKMLSSIKSPTKHLWSLKGLFYHCAFTPVLKPSPGWEENSPFPPKNQWTLLKVPVSLYLIKQKSPVDYSSYYRFSLEPSKNLKQERFNFLETEEVKKGRIRGGDEGEGGERGVGPSVCQVEFKSRVLSRQSGGALLPWRNWSDSAETKQDMHVRQKPSPNLSFSGCLVYICLFFLSFFLYLFSNGQYSTVI